MEQIFAKGVFFLLAIPLVACALVVVLSPNLFRTGIALTAALSLVAGIFAMLSADFLAAGQILMYVGGIMVIILFVIMMLQRRELGAADGGGRWLLGLLLSTGIGAYLIALFRDSFPDAEAFRAGLPTTAGLGRLLLGEMALPFEIVSLLLLAALLGAVTFSQRVSTEKEPQ
jgi:NADH:ubiquinone oxidoreductase subunit 6 (subunit J)